MVPSTKFLALSKALCTSVRLGSSISLRTNASISTLVLSRYVEGGGDRRILLRTLSSKYFNSLCRTILRTPIKDFTSSIFLMKRKILDEVTFRLWSWRIFS